MFKEKTYILECQKLNNDGFYEHVGNIDKIFNTKREAIKFHNFCNPDNPIKKLVSNVSHDGFRYVVKSYHGEVLDLEVKDPCILL